MQIVNDDELYIVKPDGEEILMSEVVFCGFDTGEKDKSVFNITSSVSSALSAICTITIDEENQKAINHLFARDMYRLFYGKLPGSRRTKRLRKKRISLVNKWYNRTMNPAYR